jgi:predicted DNA-binding transcriptional regulator AlpA
MTDVNLISAKKVAYKLSCSLSHVWVLNRQDPTFPKPINIGLGDGQKRGTRWIESAVSEWLLAKQTKKVHHNENGRSGEELHPDAREESAAQSSV